MLTPEQKTERLTPFNHLQVFMYVARKENGNTKSKQLPRKIMNLVGHYLLMPTMLECLSALVTFMQQDGFLFDTSELNAIDEALKKASGMKDSEQKTINEITNTALANVTQLIGNSKQYLEYLLREAAKTGNQLAVAQLLKMDGIDVNAKNSRDGWTALMYAVLNGHEAVVAQLLNVIGIDVNAKGKDGYTALILATIFERLAVVKQLLEADSIDINAKDKNSYTALILAAREGYKNIVAQLLKVDGININARNKDGLTALMWAASRDHKTVVHQLCLHQLFDMPFDQNDAAFQQLQNEIQSANVSIKITPASLCEYLMATVETLPTTAEQIALLEKALSKDNAFSVLMTEELLSQIQDAVNDLRTQETKPVIFSSSSAEASSSSSTNKASCKQ